MLSGNWAKGWGSCKKIFSTKILIFLMINIHAYVLLFVIIERTLEKGCVGALEFHGLPKSCTCLFMSNWNGLWPWAHRNRQILTTVFSYFIETHCLLTHANFLYLLPIFPFSSVSIVVSCQILKEILFPIIQTSHPNYRTVVNGNPFSAFIRLLIWFFGGKSCLTTTRLIF